MNLVPGYGEPYCSVAIGSSGVPSLSHTIFFIKSAVGSYLHVLVVLSLDIRIYGLLELLLLQLYFFVPLFAVDTFFYKIY
eukprot:SAG11_NODE_25_length_23789_cov_23.813592_1_plen_80_part_00